jgi:phosphoribosylformylglycinamidine cyclo-ligase
MPDVYPPGEIDLCGFAVGVVELKRATRPTRVRPGDVVLGLESDGVHSNGYTLVRKVVEAAGLDLGRVYPELATSAKQQGGKAAKRGRGGTKGEEGPRTLGQVLLMPTRIYAAPIVKLLRSYTVKNVISGMAHITGSGMAGNLERALHKGVDAVIDTKSWEPLPVFRFLQEHGRITDGEMRRVFNMGIGYTLIVRPAFAESVGEQLTRFGERVHVIGRIVKGSGAVREVG